MKKISKSKCPLCNADISYWKIMRHSWFTPIKCPGCDAKLICYKAESYKKSLYVVVPVIAAWICDIAGLESLPVRISLVIALIIGMILLLNSVRNMKLREKTKKV